MELGSTAAADRLRQIGLDSATPFESPADKPDVAATIVGEGGPTFADSVASVAQSTVDAIVGGESAAEAMVAGKADPHSVVEALAAAEMALETAVSVRDRVVSAYQEILRMPV